MITLDQMASALVLAAENSAKIKDSLEAVAVIIETESKSMIGHYQQGWAQLADSTEARKARLGYPPNAPLLATGMMRDSIEHHIKGLSANIGTNDRKMRYHEFGTNKIPPRPVFGLVFDRKKNEILDLIGESTQRLL